MINANAILAIALKLAESPEPLDGGDVARELNRSLVAAGHPELDHEALARACAEFLGRRFGDLTLAEILDELQRPVAWPAGLEARHRRSQQLQMAADEMRALARAIERGLH